jgi:hypothetical protein
MHLEMDWCYLMCQIGDWYGLALIRTLLWVVYLNEASDNVYLFHKHIHIIKYIMSIHHSTDQSLYTFGTLSVLLFPFKSELPNGVFVNDQHDIILFVFCSFHHACCNALLPVECARNVIFHYCK